MVTHNNKILSTYHNINYAGYTYIGSKIYKITGEGKSVNHFTLWVYGYNPIYVVWLAKAMN